YPGLVRAADLIGQLSDPSYLRKLPALFWEFEETGVNRVLRYRTAEDLRRGYPRFYWQAVQPYIAEALRHLRWTQRGQQILAHLFSQVFVVEHEQLQEPPAPGADATGLATARANGRPLRGPASPSQPTGNENGTPCCPTQVLARAKT